MKWTPGGMSRNVEDRRGQGGGGFRMGGGMGIGGVLIALVLSLIFGGDIFSGGGDGGAPPPGSTTETSAGAIQQSPEENERAQFMSFVLDDAQQVWAQTLPKYGNQYREAKLVLFRQATQSGCGFAQSGMGPFYCPLDEKVYIDLAFYDQLDRQLGAGGDFAQAYVLAHEIGHHVQHVLGTDTRVRELQERRPNVANDLSVRMELQADCYAGVWGASTSQRNLLDPGDVEEGLAAAAAVGDDRLQGRSGGGVNPETFTHGTSEQRATWFRRGFTTGDPRNCDTFAGAI
jgi:predicted metalloprotease